MTEPSVEADDKHQPETRPRGRAQSLAHKVAVNSSAQAVRQIYILFAGLVSVAIVTRYLSIDEFGQIIAALAVVSLFAVAGDFGITATTARMMAQQPERHSQLATSAMWTWVAFSIATAAVVVVVSLVAYPGPEQALTRQCVLIILLSSTLLAPFSGVAHATAIVEQRVWLLAFGTVAARTIALGIIVAAIALDLGPIGITVGYGAGFFLASAFSIALVRPSLPFRVPDLTQVRVLVAAAVPLGAVMAVNSLYFKLDAFLLTLLGSTKDVAIYGVAYRAFDMIVVLPGFVMITLLPELARLRTTDPRFAQLVQKAFTAMCLIAAPLLGLTLVGSEAMALLGGAKYSQGGLVLSLILVSVALGCVNGVFGNALVSQGRQGALLKVALLNLGVNGLLNLAAIPLWGARGAAAALCASEITSLVSTMLVFRGIAPLPRLEKPLRFGMALGAMAAVTTVCLLVSEDDIVTLLFAIAIGIPAYFATLVALRAIPPYIAEPVLTTVAGLRRRFT